jgi:hypothetical protein
MKFHSTQFVARENTASSRLHTSRLAVGSSSRESRRGAELLDEKAATFSHPNHKADACDSPLAEASEAAVKRDRDGGQLLTVDELAARLNVSRNWVYVHASALGVYRLGKYLRFSWPRVLERLGS